MGPLVRADVEQTRLSLDTLSGSARLLSRDVRPAHNVQPYLSESKHHRVQALDCAAVDCLRFAHSPFTPAAQISSTAQSHNTLFQPIRIGCEVALAKPMLPICGVLLGRGEVTSNVGPAPRALEPTRWSTRKSNVRKPKSEQTAGISDEL